MLFRSGDDMWLYAFRFRRIREHESETLRQGVYVAAIGPLDRAGVRKADKVFRHGANREDWRGLNGFFEEVPFTTEAGEKFMRYLMADEPTMTVEQMLKLQRISADRIRFYHLCGCGPADAGQASRDR